MYVKSPDNKSMYIGKHSTGIPVSGSENISRYVTGSGGGTFDIGFTHVDETGEVVFTTLAMEFMLMVTIIGTQVILKLVILIIL